VLDLTVAVLIAGSISTGFNVLKSGDVLPACVMKSTNTGDGDNNNAVCQRRTEINL